MAAMGLVRGQTALGAFYRRLAVRVGKPKAITATARKLAILVYRTLTGTLVYKDPITLGAIGHLHRPSTVTPPAPTQTTRRYPSAKTKPASAGSLPLTELMAFLVLGRAGPLLAPRQFAPL